MKRYSVCTVLILLLVFGVVFSAQAAGPTIADLVLSDVHDKTNHTIRIEVSQESITGAHAVGTSLTANTTGGDNDSWVAGDTDTALVYVDAGNDRVGISTSTPSVLFHLFTSTALTNTVSVPFRITHDTSGSPTTGIGVGLDFEQETSAANNEVGMSLNAVVADGTGGSEDFDFIVKLMKAGAAVAEAFKVTSTGVVTLVNAATIDNSTNGTVAITEPTIYLEGAVKQKACTIADGDATPDVTGCRVLTTSANTGATAITDLDNPVVGAVYTIIGGSATNSSTIADSGNFNLNTAFTAAVDDVIHIYVQADNDYIELGRVDN